MKIRPEAIRDCLEGVIPGTIATAASDGTPNIAYLSQVQYVDGEHVALSYQFFNTTRRNILANPFARVAVVDPLIGAHYRLSLQYLRTEEEGPLFEKMKAKLISVSRAGLEVALEPYNVSGFLPARLLGERIEIKGPTLTARSGRTQRSFTEGYPIAVRLKDVDFMRLALMLEIA